MTAERVKLGQPIRTNTVELPMEASHLDPLGKFCVRLEDAVSSVDVPQGMRALFLAVRVAEGSGGHDELVVGCAGYPDDEATMHAAQITDLVAAAAGLAERYGLEVTVSEMGASIPDTLPEG